MAIFNRKLASKEDLFYAYVACSFPIFLWAFYKIFLDVPAWILRMSVLDILSVLAYALALAVIESLVIWGLFVLLSLVLPHSWFRIQFVPVVTVITFISAIWAVSAQNRYAMVFEWSFIEALPWLALAILTVFIGYMFVIRSSGLANLLYKLAQKLSVLTSLYIFLGLFGILVVIIRNI